MMGAAEPFWGAPALLGALIASLGYVGKTTTDLFLKINQNSRDRRSRLAELYAVIRAGDAAFNAQTRLRFSLARQLQSRLSGSLHPREGHESLFAATFPLMNDDERRIHALIRAMTVHTIHPLNQTLLQWLRNDNHYRSASPADRKLGRLAVYLAQLEAHLVIWIAKYEAWIPEHPEHALVFLADEEEHGVGFPASGALIIAKVLGHPPIASNGRSVP